MTFCRKVGKTSQSRMAVAGRRISLNFPSNTYEMFALMLDTSGVVYFNERYNDNPRTYANWIEETPEGNFIVSGAAGSRIWAIEIDTNGSEIRRQTFYQTPTNAVLNETACIKQAPGGRFIAAGGPVNFSPGFYFLGSFSAFASSSQIWGGEMSGGICLIPEITIDGSIVLPHGFTRPLLTKFDSDCTVIWQVPLPRPTPTAGSFLRAFAYLPDSSAIAVGRYQDINDQLAPDFYLCRIRNVGVPYNPAHPVGTKPSYKGLPPLVAYPTPTTSTLTVHTRSRLPIAVYSLSGKMLLVARADGSGTTSLDLGALPKGMYVLRQEEAYVKVVRE